MTTILQRARSKASHLDLQAPDTSDLRERIKDIVDDAIERVGDIVDGSDRTGRAGDAARSVGRNAKLVDLAPAAIMAVGPGVVRAMRERAAARRTFATRTLAVVPVAVTRRSMLVGGGAAAGVVAGLLLARWAIKRRAARRRAAEDLSIQHDTYVAEIDPKQFDLEAEVERMEDEGGDPSGSRVRRFVRSS